jgi:DNA-binding Lrp family transcriptional regulator
MVLTRKIDEIDKKILCMLYQDPQVSHTELSKRLKISQPAVSARMHKLEEEAVLTHMIGIDIKKTQLFLAKLDISTDNVEEILKFLDKCPLYLNSFLTSGKCNMTVLLVGENIRSIMSCVDSHLRKNLPAKNMEFDLIVTPARSLIVPIKPNMEKKRVTPCGADCGNCTLYMSDRCLGCPVSLHYKGNLL